jgi:cell division septation protein DedD
VDESPQRASRENASIESPDLPDRWRGPGHAVWRDPDLAAFRRARARRVALVVLAVVFVVALVIGMQFDLAAVRYGSGVEALKIHSYSRAAREFAAARVFGFPYRDARALEEQASRAAVGDVALRGQSEALRVAIVARLQKAGARLAAGDAGGVLKTLQGIDQNDLQATLTSSETVRESADALALDLGAASRKALGNAAWGRAGHFAAALLLLEPSSKRAAALRAHARTGEDLSAELGQAKDAARRGKWRAALRLALAVLARQKGFPGAAAVVADARHALAPKPAPVAAQPAQPAPPAQPATGGSTTPVAPQPPPP